MPTPVLTQTPNAGDILSDSQVDLQNNFTYLQTGLNRDHIVDFYGNTSDAKQCLHKKVSLVPQVSPDPVMTPGAQSLLYTFSNNLYFKNSSNVPVGIKLTNNEASSPLSTGNGMSWLPGGLMIQWGQFTSASNPATVTFPVAFSAPPFSIVATVANPATQTVSVQVRAQTMTNFTYYTFSGSSSAVNMPINWIAIGPK